MLNLETAVLFAFAGLITLGCEAQVKPGEAVPVSVSNPDKFSKYWYAGEAELNRYEVTQMRYGEKRTGEAVLVYVTEDFLPERQVKDETGQESSVSVMKLNMMKKFETGIYDYSIMTSVFTPIDYRKQPYTLKVSFSSQDWCGQVFGQLNLRERTLEYQWRSYFEKEGDVEGTMDATYFEEDIWTRLRLEPQTVPLGEVDVIPSQEYLRLMHKPLKAYAAKGDLSLLITDDKIGKEYYVYRLHYPELERTLTWRCDSKFPYSIVSFEEETKNRDGQKETTTAKLTNTLKNSYWNLNKNEDSALRDSLGVKYGVRD
ncbi:MAG: septum formation inhibitor Maf [Cryomorphaceae bacterium]|nr:septum formation inhibitor Maf [Flavobacteriales bacterium]